MRRIFGPNRDEMAGGLRKLHIEKLYNLYASRDIVRVIMSKRRIWADHVTHIGKVKISYRSLVGSSAGKRPLETSRRRQNNNIKTDLGC